MKRIISCLLVVCLMSSCSSLQSIISEPTSLETITALKDVLNSSAFKALETLSKLKSGPESVLPEEIRPVLGALKNLGLGKEVEKVSQQIGKASELTLAESKGVMLDAVKELNFGDAVAIVLGGEDAATSVFKRAMYSSVKTRYSEKLDAELSKTDALKYWPMASGAYNIFAKKKVNGSLSDFMAERAVDGLFLAMGKEEAKIRQDPHQMKNAVVSKVFDYYQKKGK